MLERKANQNTHIITHIISFFLYHLNKEHLSFKCVNISDRLFQQTSTEQICYWIKSINPCPWIILNTLKVTHTFAFDEFIIMLCWTKKGLKLETWDVSKMVKGLRWWKAYKSVCKRERKRVREKKRKKETELQKENLTSFTGGAAVARSAHAGAVLWGAWASVLARAGHGAVGPPETLRADVVTVDPCCRNTLAQRCETLSLFYWTKQTTQTAEKWHIGKTKSQS